jgi:hypothetical protein
MKRKDVREHEDADDPTAEPSLKLVFEYVVGR